MEHHDSPYKFVGQFSGTLSFKTKSTLQPIFIIKGLRNNLLGLPAIEALSVVARLETTAAGSCDRASVMEKYPSLFTGLGNMGEEYEIQLKPSAKPYSIFTPRNVPLPLRDKVREELTRMESLGVISKVDTPTPWCAGMVVVPKKSGAIRVCVDLKPLNESVLREVHPLPKVDDALAQLHDARVFTKLDANSGFWQIPLAERSKALTTFLTPFGRYHFNKLPFGISSAPELFQKRMSKILIGLEEVICSIDDVLVVGKDYQEHEERLTAVLERLKSAGITLNSAKCEFQKDRLIFLGHLIYKDGV